MFGARRRSCLAATLPRPFAEWCNRLFVALCHASHATKATYVETRDPSWRGQAFDHTEGYELQKSRRARIGCERRAGVRRQNSMAVEKVVVSQVGRLAMRRGDQAWAVAGF